MAFTKLAIVRGEWQLDPDQVFRLYVRPTLELIDRAGETHHVPAFATTARRTSDPRSTTSGTLFCSSSETSDSFGGRHGQDFTASDQKWLEPLSPDQSFHMLGELSNDSSPIMAALISRSAIQWLATDMEPELVCIDDAIETNQFDGQLIEILKRFKVG
jgi:hypothetical protein